MAYIGKSIESGTFSVLDTSGNTYNGSNVTFSLGTQVGSPAQLLVSHDGVIQKPGTDYTLATGGTQITFTTAPASGASIFIVEISGAVGGPLDSDLNGTELILDADGDTSITADTDDQIDVKVAGTDQITIKDGAVSPVTDNDVDLGTTSLEFKDGYFDGTLHCDVLDLAGTEHTSITGFSVSSITGATALATQPDQTDEIVLSDAGTLKRLDIKHIQCVPAFAAQLSGNQELSTGSATKINFNSEDLDTNSAYDNSTNYRFTPAIAGYYFVYALLPFDELSDGKSAYCMIYKNGSHFFSATQMTGAATRMAVPQVSATIYLDDDDYVEIYGQHDHGSNRNVIGNSSTEAFFGAFRISGAPTTQ